MANKQLRNIPILVIFLGAGSILLAGCHQEATVPAVTPAAQAPAAQGSVQDQIQAIQNSSMPPTLKAQQISNLRQRNHQLPDGSPIPAAPTTSY